MANEKQSHFEYDKENHIILVEVEKYIIYLDVISVRSQYLALFIILAMKQYTSFNILYKGKPKTI